MERQGYDAFKQRLREWMETHPTEYDWFEAEMNRKDDAGYQMVLMQAVALVPEYQAIVSKRINQAPEENISDIEQLLKEGDLVKKINASFDQPFEETIAPAMFSWLWFRQSFERMVERGEELRRNTEIPTHQKMLIAQVIKMLIDKSIELGLRTKADWEKQYSWMQLADCDDIIGGILTNNVDKKKRGRQSTSMPLSDMFTPLADDPGEMIEKIRRYLTTKHSQTDIARLKISLDELQYLISPVDIKSFRNALHEQFSPSIHIIHERGVQEAYNRLNTSLPTGRRPSDIGEDRDAIAALKAFLSD